MPTYSLDLESTGTDPAKDRIVQIAIIPIDPPGPATTRLVNPGIPIPPEATTVHGITDAHVAAEPLFYNFAKALREILTGADLITFNGRDFDIPMLAEEFARAGIDWEPTGRMLDTFQLYRHFHPRTLAAAVREYLGREHEGAHDAEADARAAAAVLNAMEHRHGLAGLPDDVARISAGDTVRIDLAGKLIRRADGEAVITIGKAKGKTVREEPGFARWMLAQSFTANTMKHVRAELARVGE